ncbi:MAG: primosomal protein N' [Candidatus Sericytochromatia bacterium]|nr:MAG: primosomal protein N' [Candidatus Sericytochromatia bacterium]
MTLFADVLVDTYTDLEHQVLTYFVPNFLENKVKLGMPVLVPFGSSYIGGYIVNLHSNNILDDSINIKSIEAISNEELFDSNYLNFLKWISEYYFVPFISVLKIAIPSGILTKVIKYIELVKSKENFLNYIELNTKGLFKEFCLKILEEDNIEINKLKNYFLQTNKYLNKLKEDGYIKINFCFKKKSNFKKQVFISFISDNCNDRLTDKQKEVLNIIKKYKVISKKQLLNILNISDSILKTLEKKSCISIYKDIVLRKPHDYDIKDYDYKTFELNEYQKKAINTFLELKKSNNKQKVILLHGVTGSGKTEIYIKAVEEILKENKSSIIMVPEISLIPQTLKRFRSRFSNEKIAVLHSFLSEGEKFDEWQKIKEGIAKIIIGARSSIFSPCKDLGLIVIDEEHEHSYKQDNNIRYNAKTLALKRIELSNAVLILGSATPSIETYYEALNNKNWKLINIPNRISNKNLPEMKIVDMKEEYLRGNRGIFSKILYDSIIDRLNKKEQIILFVNRRGFSPFVICRECGYSCKCTDCSVSMVYHSIGEYLKCHYCGKTTELPIKCPSCKSLSISYFGIGTQKIETICQKYFHNAKVTRLDKDVTNTKESHHNILNDFSKGKYDILIGTQMISKGLDFHNVTLVGILAADTSLNIADFRAAEKTFQLITQVAGRAGRGDIQGDVIIQTYSTNHFSIESAKKYDFKSFYLKEINDRKELMYPPFSKLINIIFSCLDFSKVSNYSNIFTEELKKNKDTSIISILGPIPCIISKIKNNYRFNTLIKTNNIEKTMDIIKKIKINQNENSVKISIDIDPINML